MPSAGTGFALSRETLRSFGEDYVMPSKSLTEDYRLSLTLYEKGIQMYYVLEKVPRINRNEKMVWDYVTTRSIFPNTFKTAVKQKTRWILGITMQSFQFRDIFKMKGLRLSGRYSLYKDLKAKVGNMLVMVGYPVLIYFLVSLFIPLTPIYPRGTLSWYLCLLVTIMMVERQLFRGVAIYNVYGMRSVFFACLFPPLLPIRLVWGNIINMTATIRAYRQTLFGTEQKKKQLLSEEIKHDPNDKSNDPETKAVSQEPVTQNEQVEQISGKLTEQSKEQQVEQVAEQSKEVEVTEKKEKKEFAWAKTDHEFIDKKVLKNYHRTIGDMLLQKGFLSSEQLKHALKETREKDERIGVYLVKEKLINEEELLDALSEVKHIQYIYSSHLDDFCLWQNADAFDEEMIRQLLILPVMKINGGYVIAFCEESPDNAQTILKERYNIRIQAAFLSTSAVREGLDLMYSKTDRNETSPAYRLLKTMMEQDKINAEQAIILRNYHYRLGLSENELLLEMGLITKETEDVTTPVTEERS